MTQNREFITGKKLIGRWYGLGKRNFYYLAGDILKYDLTVVDGVENPGTENSIIIGVKPAGIAHILQNEPQTLKKRLFYFPEIEAVERRPNFSIIDPHRRYKSSAEIKIPKTIRDVVEFEDDEIRNNHNVFALRGKVWFVKYNQKEWGLYPFHQKYKYVACLLSFSMSSKGDPLIAVRNPELISFVKKNSPEKPDSNPEDMEGLQRDHNGLGILKNKSKYLDKKFKELIDAGNELVSIIDIAQASGNPDSISDAQEKFDIFKNYMSDEYGIACGISDHGGLFIAIAGKHLTILRA
jgi:hypothetical protein